MSHEHSCPACGSPLPPDAADGLCTKCLLKTGLEEAAGDGQLHVRCPHCHNPIELVDDSPLGDITCPSCDSKFSLVGEATTTATRDGTTTIGQFALIEQVGVGGFGAVWKARDTELDRMVAVKVPRRDQISGTDLEQFMREARAAAQLKHPNIVSVHEVGRANGQVYIVSDFVDGVTLADWLSAHQLTPRETAGLCAHLAEALHHAHNCGVIHRDLKPTNIMIDARGEPHIMDFGLAKRDAGEITMTVEGKVLGTPAYMSPEQARGEGHHADARSDVYSLGVILFEMLTGDKPFRGSSRMLLHQVIHDDPPSLRKLIQGVPRDMETICLKCLEKDSQRRYQTAAEVAEEFRRFLRSEPIMAQPISSAERTWRWCKRNPRVASLTGAVVVVLLAGLVSTSTQWIRYRKEAIRAGHLAIRAGDLATQESRAKQDAVDARDQMGRHLYAAHMNLAMQAWEGANVGRVESLLKQHLPRPGEEDLRSFEWFYLWRLCHRDAVTLNHPRPVIATAYSPDGQLLATGGIGRDLRLWDVQSGECLGPLYGGGKGIMSVAFSPDGAKLFSAEGWSRFILWDVKTRQILDVIDNPLSGGESVSFSPDGRTIAFGSGPTTVILWDVEEGRMKDELQGPAMQVPAMGNSISIFRNNVRVAFSPDGTKLAAGLGDGQVLVWDLVARHFAVVDAPESPSPIHALAFSPTGETLAFNRSNEAISLWEFRTEHKRQIGQAQPGGTRALGFSRDGATLAAAGRDNIIQLHDPTTGEVKDSIIGHSGPVYSLAFAPDGSLASASRDKTVKIWKPSPARHEAPNKFQGWAVLSTDAKLLASVHSGSIAVRETATGKLLYSWDSGVQHASLRSAFDLSPDGQLLALSDIDGRIRVWNLATKQEVDNYKAYSAPVSVAFSPDGRFLASGGVHPMISVRDIGKRQLHGIQGAGTASGINALEWSPDGKQLATVGGPNWRHIDLWDVTSQRMRHTFTTGTGRFSCLAFSPDGATLAAGDLDRTVKLWDIASEKLLHNLGGHAGGVISLAFTPDGKTLASGTQFFSINLWSLPTGQAIGVLKSLDPNVLALGFSPAGDLLVSASMSGLDNGTMQRWHTAHNNSVQAEVARATIKRAQSDPHNALYNQAMLSIQQAGGDWAQRRWSEAEKSYRRSLKMFDQLLAQLPQAFAYRRQQALAYDDLAKMLFVAGRQGEAVREYRTGLLLWEQLVADFPHSAFYIHDLAAALATCPEPELRQPARAVALAQEAVDRVPINANYWNTLGVAYYQTGDWQEAIRALDKSISLTSEESAYDYLFLAMSHWQLGDQETARQWYEKAHQWMDDNTSIWSNELQLFAEEARNLLGLLEQQ